MQLFGFVIRDSLSVLCAVRWTSTITHFEVNTKGTAEAKVSFEPSSTLPCYARLCAVQCERANIYPTRDFSLLARLGRSGLRPITGATNEIGRSDGQIALSADLETAGEAPEYRPRLTTRLHSPPSYYTQSHSTLASIDYPSMIESRKVRECPASAVARRRR